jgi:arabinogalactan oligomer/maltooligosaccharide transport system substrate-binding protein
MKKLLPFILTISLLLGGCSALRGDEIETPAAADGPILTSRNIELRVLVSSGSEEEFINIAAKEFAKRYPNIAIRAETLSDDGIISRAHQGAGGNGDLFALSHIEARGLGLSQLVLPARDQAAVKSAVFPACAQAAAQDGVIYGYPVSAETTALFYNKRLIAENELPSTWDELAAFAKAFSGGHGFIMPPGSPYAAATFLLAPTNRPYNPGDLDLTYLLTSDAVKGLEVFKNLKGAAGLSSDELSDTAAASIFAQGSAALYIGRPSDAARFSSVDFGVAPLPAFGEDEPSVSLASVRVMVVSAHSEWPDEASAFADLLITEEMQKRRGELTGELPSVEVTLSGRPYAAGFFAQMQNAVGAFADPQLGFWASFGRAAARIWDGGGIQAELGALAEELKVPEEEAGE